MFILRIIIGLLFLFTGGELMVRGGVSLANYFKLSTFVIGLTIVSIGTSAPELATSLSAVLLGSSTIASGNIVGSNITNILLIIGLGALISPIQIPKYFAKIDGYFFLLSAIILVSYCYINIYMFSGKIIIGRTLALFFIITLITYIIVTIRNHREIIRIAFDSGDKSREELGVNYPPLIAGLIVMGSFILLALGGNLLATGSISLARFLGISEAVIGVTVVSFGSSTPEIITIIVASYRKNSDIAIGNILGSNSFNILGVLGIASLIKPIEIPVRFIAFDFPYLLATTLLLYVTIRRVKFIDGYLGGIFFALYITYILMQF